MASSTDTTSLPTAADILAQFYAAETAYMASPPEKRDFMSGMGVVLSPKFTSFQSPDLPWGGDWHGREGFQRWSETMAGYFQGLEVLKPKVYQEGSGGDGNSVLVRATLTLTVRGSGKMWERPMVQIVEVDRQKGWIGSIRPFYWDVAGLKEVLGV